jgi:hypothetical protein
MRTKLLALALTAMLTIGTGGVIAADSASTDDAQFENNADDVTQTPRDSEQSTDDSDQSDSDDEQPDRDDSEEYDEKLTADEHITLEPSVLSFEDDGIIGVSFQEPVQRTVTVDSGSDGTVAIEPEGDASDEHPDVNHTAGEARTHYHDAEMTGPVELTGNETYDEKLTADESITLEPSVLSFEDDGIIRISFQEPTQKDVTVDSTGNSTVSVTAADA